MTCALCQREVNKLEFHHFEPGKKRRKTKAGIKVCQQCGDQVHLLFDNNILRNSLNSLELLQANPKMQKYLLWIRKKPSNKKYCTKQKKRI